LRIEATRVIPRPGGLDPVAAAALWVGHSTAYSALIDTAGMRPGDSVLITAEEGGDAANGAASATASKPPRLEANARPCRNGARPH
jgi:D-arabinose 1-dehydrogenase-like Zn-dependent alcohol dehydrogenase